jgi:hypothetical protein
VLLQVAQEPELEGRQRDPPPVEDELVSSGVHDALLVALKLASHDLAGA